MSKIDFSKLTFKQLCAFILCVSALFASISALVYTGVLSPSEAQIYLNQYNEMLNELADNLNMTIQEVNATLWTSWNPTIPTWYGVNSYIVSSVEGTSSTYYFMKNESTGKVDYYGTNKTKTLSNACMNLSSTPGTVALKEVAWEYTNVTLPEDVLVVEQLNAQTRKFINSADTMGSPYTISTGNGDGYYTAEDYHENIINSWTSTQFSTVFNNLQGNLTTGAVIEFAPSSTFVSDAQCNVTVNNCTIRGSKSSIISLTANRYAFYNTANETVFDGFQISGNLALASLDYGIVSVNTYETTYRNLAINNLYVGIFHNATSWAASKYCKIVNNEINTMGTGGRGIWVKGGALYTTITANIIHNCYTNIDIESWDGSITANDMESGYRGVYLHSGSQQWAVSANWIQHTTGAAIYQGSGKFNNFAANNIIDCNIYNDTAAIYIAPSTGLTDFLISDNQIQGCHAHGISLVNTDNCTILGNDLLGGDTNFGSGSGLNNEVANTALIGILLNGTSKNCLINENHVKNYTQYGISLASTCSNNTIGEDNKILDCPIAYDNQQANNPIQTQIVRSYWQVSINTQAGTANRTFLTPLYFPYQSGNVTEFSFSIGTESAGSNIFGVIYAGTQVTPLNGALLWNGTVSVATNGDKTINLTNGLTLSRGWYWVGLMTNDTTVTFHRSTVSIGIAGSASPVFSGCYFDSTSYQPPATCPALTTSQTAKVLIYLTTTQIIP